MSRGFTADNQILFSTLLDPPLALAGERDLGEIELLLQQHIGVGADALLGAQLLQPLALPAHGGEAQAALLLERAGDTGRRRGRAGQLERIAPMIRGAAGLV